VGAVSRSGLLRLPPAPLSLIDVDQFRAEPRRVAVVRGIPRPTLVLGSTQPEAVVSADALEAHGVGLARRRGGGGLVYLDPADPLWLDAWIPRDDPLWVADVAAAAEWIGAWWTRALAEVGVAGVHVHAGRAVPGEYGELICFAGRGPGEVFVGGRKVVGLSQWRAREGALFSSCAYLRWDPVAMVGLLEVADGRRRELDAGLREVAVGLGDLDPPLRDLAVLRDRLLASFPSFELSGGSEEATGSP